ncbi:hypothetical protein ACWCOP_13570 [Maricaulaceae bacterium MS644]
MQTELFFVGDSHVCALAEAATARGVAWRGGPLGAGKQLLEPFWRVEGGEFVFTGPGAAQLTDRFRPLLSFDGPIVSTIGVNTRRFVRDFAHWAERLGAPASPDAVSSATLEALVADSRRTALEFYAVLAAHGRTVYSVATPPRISRDYLALCKAFETRLTEDLKAAGANPLDVGEAADEDGLLRAQFASPADEAHAGRAFGELVLDALARRL